MKNRKAKERESMLEELCPGGAAKVWPRVNEPGWFKGPRALPVILAMLNTKEFRGTLDIASTYLAVLAENWDEGLVRVESETEFAMLSGFRADTRGLRGWRERMRKLEQLGLIRTFPYGTQAIGFIMVIHPCDVVNRLKKDGKLRDPGLWNLYQAKLRSAGATPVTKPKVVPLPLRFRAKG